MVSAATLLLAQLMAGVATAQEAPPVEVPELNTNLYRLPLDSRGTLWAEDASRSDPGQLSARLGLSYLNAPLVATDARGARTHVLGDAVISDLLVGYSLGRLRLGAHLPLVLDSSSEVAAGGAGLGDVGLDVKGTLTDRRDSRVGLALLGRVSAPTATVDVPLGSIGPTYEVSAVVDTYVGRLLLVGNLGTRGQPAVDLDNVVVDDQFLYRLGAGYALTASVGLSADLQGHVTYGADPTNGSAAPLEALVGGWVDLSEALALRGGVGTGLGEGVGAPAARGVFALSWVPGGGGGDASARPAAGGDADADGDGLGDASDQCPAEAEDLDGFADGDGCPDPGTTVLVRVLDPDGRPVRDAVVTLSGDAGAAEGGHGLRAELHPASYQLDIEAAGYRPLGLAVDIPEEEVHELAVNLEPMVGRLVVRVVDERGRPVEGAMVAFGEEAAVEAPGGVREGDVAAGTHVLTVRAAGFVDATKRAPVTVDSTTEITVVLRRG